MPSTLNLKLDENEDIRVALGIALPQLLSSILQIEVDDSSKCSDPSRESQSEPSPLSAAVATSSSGFSGKEKQIGLSKIIIRSILQLLNDAVVRVRFAVFSQLLCPSNRNVIPMVFTPFYVSRLYAAITPLRCNTDWRMRKAVCTALPMLVSASRTVEMRSEAAALVLPMLKDDVFEVRRCAATALCIAGHCDEPNGAIASGILPPTTGTIAADSATAEDQEEGENVLEHDMGRMWLDHVIIPHVLSMAASSRFHERILSMHMICAVIIEGVVATGDTRLKLLMSAAFSLASDKVVNVRLALATALLRIVPHLKLAAANAVMGEDNAPVWCEGLIKTVQKLNGDSNREVARVAANLEQLLWKSLSPDDPKYIEPPCLS